MRRQIHATIAGVLSNSVTGYSLVSYGIRNFSFDLVTLTSFSTGSNTLVHQPGGGGTIRLGTGRLQFDDTTGQVVGYHGPTDDGEYDDLSPPCPDPSCGVPGYQRRDLSGVGVVRRSERAP